MLGKVRHGKVFISKGVIMEYVVDTTGIGPGDVVDEATCQSVVGITEADNPKLWQLGLLQLSQIVANQLRKEHGRELTVRIKENGIHVLTDQEAAEYNPRRFDSGLKIARRSHRRLMSVDVSKLTQEARTTHARELTIQAFKLSLLRKRETIALPVSKRTTPVVLKRS